MSLNIFVSSLGRLSDRRGIHKLAHIDPPSTIVSAPRTMSHEPQQSFDSLAPSLASSSSPAVPATNTSSFANSTRKSSFEQSPTMTSTHEDDDNAWYGSITTQVYGLGLEYRHGAESRGRHLKSGSLSERMQNNGTVISPASSIVWEGNEGDCPDSPSDDRDISMPPTPPSASGENLFCNYMSQSPALENSAVDELYDPEAFSEPSVPTSPVSEPSGRLSRRNTVLNKINRLRPLMKRRSSSSSSMTHTPPPIPHISTMPTFYTKSRPSTPPADFDAYFPHSVPLPDNTSFSSVEEMTRDHVGTPPLPPLLSNIPMTGQLPSPLAPATKTAVLANPSENFPEVITSNLPEPIRSPLPPAPISPLGSPAMSPLLCTTLNMISPLVLSPHHHQQVVPDVVGPASPALMSPGHRRKASGDSKSRPVTANILADMIEQMQREDEAFVVTEKHLSESGWNTPEEIESIRQQRAESKLDWEKRIEESKQILVDIRRSEVKSNNKKYNNVSPYAFASPAESKESIDSRISQ